MRTIRKIWCVSFKIWAKNTDFGLFWPKMANFGPFLAKKGPILNFRPKSETVTFLRLLSLGFMKKTEKSDAWISGKSSYGRTDGRESIGLQESRFLETNKVSSHREVERCKKCWFSVIFDHFYTTRPLKWAKIWSHGAAWQTKILKKYSTKNISYKKIEYKKV